MSTKIWRPSLCILNIVFASFGWISHDRLGGYESFKSRSVSLKALVSVVTVMFGGRLVVLNRYRNDCLHINSSSPGQWKFFCFCFVFFVWDQRYHTIRGFCCRWI